MIKCCFVCDHSKKIDDVSEQPVHLRAARTPQQKDLKEQELLSVPCLQKCRACCSWSVGGSSRSWSKQVSDQGVTYVSGTHERVVRRRRM
jgi:hypothetical protein